MGKVFACLALTVFSSCAFANISTEIKPFEWEGSGSCDNWSYLDLGSPYSEDGAAKFAKGGAAISSPTFNGSIVKIEIEVKSSSENPLRPLKLVLSSGRETAVKELELQPTATSTKYVKEEFEIDRNLYADNLTIKLGAGTSGNWGVKSIAVEIIENKPSGAYVKTAGSSSFTAVWTNGMDCVSNEVIAIVATDIPFSVNYEAKYDFSEITNTAGQTKSVLGQVTGLYPELSGKEVNAPANFGGAVMLGKYDAFGILTIDYPRSYAGKRFVIEAQRFNSEDEGWTMPIFYAAGGTTNDLGTISLDKNYAKGTYSFPLEGIPDEAVLIIHSVTNKANNSRVSGRTLVYSAGIANSVTEAHTKTNTIARVFASGSNTTKINGLDEETEYLWSVRGFAADGFASKYLEYMKIKTEPQSGFGISIK